MKNFKKLSLITVFMFIAFLAFADASDYELNNVKDEYIGTYIPVDLELRLYQSKKFYESLRASRKYEETRPHDVLFLQKDICYSDSGFHDGYAIQTKEFINYKFITGQGGVFCIDDNGYLYRKFSNEEYGYKEYIEYVMKIILSNSSAIKIQNGNLIIDNIVYEVNLDGNFFDITDTAILLFNDALNAGWYFLVKDGNDGVLYSGKRTENSIEITKDKVIKRFPKMFKTNVNELPDYSAVPKDQLRLFRNLIFARNGYIFKSTDLRDFFNSCSWYNQNPAFTETELRKDEKDFISLIQKYEGK